MKNRKENMNTTLEIPEGSKATIAAKNIDGKHYLVVEVEERIPEWKKFKRGDVLICVKMGKDPIYAIFDRYVPGSNRDLFDCRFPWSWSFGNHNWWSDAFRIATEEEEAEFFKRLREEKGLEWDGEKLVEVPKKGDLCIFWDQTPREAIMAIYRGFDTGTKRHFDHTEFYWYNAIKWDGAKEQYEKVLRGEL